MTRSQLIEAVHACHPQLAPDDSRVVVGMLLDAMALALAAGQRVEIRGFGSFAPCHRPPRTSRNPRTGARVHVPGKFVPHFRAGKALRERVNCPGRGSASRKARHDG